MQNVSSFTLSNSGNGPAVNQEDHDDDDHECDPAVEDCTTDSDGDGTPDWDDDCEDHAGPPENYGCPEGMTPYSGPDDGDDGYDDPDGDGIVGEWDECPNTHGGPNEVRGCPDSDADGVADYEDSCPGEMEDWMGPLDGCPTANDSDGDGVPDDQDNCPNTGNQDQADFNGDGSGDVCSDADGDGYYDSFDQCPSEPAVASGDGCPPVDSDGDGVSDDIDQCPNEPGNVNGCPAPTDSDGDGIPDSSDSCPNEYGTQSNGCPEIQNMPPMIISPTSITTNADTPVQFTIIASDPDGPQDQVSFNPQIQPQHGTLSFVPGTQVGNQHDYIYSPYSGYSGPDSFGIMAWDGLVNSEITTITITVIPVDETPTDSDGDGIPDSSDSCPNEYGTQSNGCPLDSDGDGIPDSSDSCPFDPENDADNDGYCVPEDLCPYEYTSDSTYSIGGCPDTPPPADSDGDGITDDVDSCPSQAENYNNYQDTDGCPDTLPEGNIPPEIIVPTSITTNMNTPVTFRAIITEPDGPQKEPSIYHWIEEKHGTFDVKQLAGLDREYTYTPHKDYVGTDTFTLRVWDGKVNTDAPVTITIKAVDYSFDQDGDGINDDTDQCKSEPENFNQYLDDDGCPDSIPTVTNVSEITVDKIPDFHEYFNYIVSGYLKSPNGLPIDRAELVVSLINTDTGSEVYGHNYGKPQKVTTIGDGSWITWVGGKSFVGNHKLVITFEGNSFYDKSEVSFPVEVKPLGGLPGCVQYDEYTYFKKVPSGEVLCDDFHGTVRLKDNKITSPGTVQYGDEFQAIGYNFRFVNPDNMLISIYNPCDELIHKSPIIIHTTGQFWPKFSASGQGWDISGVYKLIAHHEKSGNYVAETTFTIQSSGPFVSSPSDSQCTGTTPTTPTTPTPPLPTGEPTGKITSPGTVQYGDEFQAIGYNDNYVNPDNMLISIYNPCNKLIHKSPIIIHTTGQFWPKFSASGQGWDISGVYKLIAHHEKSGNYVAETTFTIQSSGPFVSSPSDSQCSEQSSGSGSWKGQVTGYGTLLTEYNKYIYSIDGSFNFDILDNGDIKGKGISGVEISKTYGYVDAYGYDTYSCWSIDNKPKSISFQTKGEISNGKAYLYLGDGAPNDIWLTIWCDIPGYHQDVQKVYDPFWFNSDAILTLKEGATATTSTPGPFADSSGTINWTFKITEAGNLDPKFSSEPPKPVPVKPVPQPPKIIPPPTPPPQVTLTPPPKILPPQAPAPPKAPDPNAPVYVPPTPTPTPTPTPISLSVDTDRTTYNQGNLVTVNAEIDGVTSNANIAINVIDPFGNAVMTRTLFTDDTGTIPFKVSHGTTAGSYKVTASVNVNGQNYEATSQFTIKKDLAGLSIKSVSATNQQGNPVNSFSQGNQGHIKIILSSDSFVADSLVTVTVLDSDLVALGTSSIKTSISSGDSEIILSYYIPDDASTGNANIYVNAFTDWPSNSGVPLTRESSTEIGIGVNTSPSTTQTNIAPPATPYIPPSPTTTKQVTIPLGTATPGCESANLCYFPSTITINQGDTVQWNNKDNAAHTVTSGNPSAGPDDIFDSSLFMAGTSYKVDFYNKGTFDYYCMVHPWMEGNVIVK